MPLALWPAPLDARLACAEPPRPSSDRLDENDLGDDAKQALRAAAGERIKLELKGSARKQAQTATGRSNRNEGKDREKRRLISSVKKEASGQGPW